MTRFCSLIGSEDTTVFQRVPWISGRHISHLILLQKNACLDLNISSNVSKMYKLMLKYHIFQWKKSLLELDKLKLRTGHFSKMCHFENDPFLTIILILFIRKWRLLVCTIFTKTTMTLRVCVWLQKFFVLTDPLISHACFLFIHKSC